MGEFGLRDILFVATVFAICGVALVRPFLGLQAFLVFSIVNPHGMAWSIASTFHPVQPIAGSTLVGYLFSSEPKRLPRQAETYLLLGLWAMFGVSTLTAVYPDEAWALLTRVSKILVMVVLSMALANTRERVVQLARVIALSLGFLGFKGGLFAVISGGQYMVWGPEKSFLEANNAIGLALAMNLPLLFYLRKLEPRRWLKHVMTAMMLLSYPAIVCTFARSAWLAAAAATLVMMWSSRFRFAIATATVAAVMVVPPLLPERVLNRYDDLKNYEEESSAQSRLWTWEFCRRVGMANPVSGAGFAFPSERTYARYYPEFLAWRGKVASCHSTWLTVFGEHGVPGFLLWTGLIITCLVSLVRIHRGARAAPDQAWAMAIAPMVGASLLAFMVGGTFLDLAYFDIFYQLVALVAVTKTIVGLKPGPDTAPAAPATVRPRVVVVGPRALVAVGVTTALLASALPAMAQTGDPFHAISRNRTIIRIQLAMGVTNLQQAVQVAQTSGDLEAARELASEAYVLMRFATHGIELLQNKTRNKNYTDPLLELCSAKVWSSRLINIEARRDLDNALAAPVNGSAYAAQAIAKLAAALRDAQEAADLF